MPLCFYAHNRHFVREGSDAAKHLQCAAVLLGGEIYSSANLALLGDCVALDAVENIERAVDALCHNLLSIKRSRHLYLCALRGDMLLVEYPLHRYRRTERSGIEYKLLGVHLFDLFANGVELPLLVHFDSNFDSHS